MKIEKIDLSEEYTGQWGIKPIRMDRLNEIVVIAGKNGSGKTRFLALLKKLVNDMPMENEIEQLTNRLQSMNEGIKDSYIQIEHQTSLLTNPPVGVTTAELKSNITQNERRITNWKQQIEQTEKRLDSIKFIKFNAFKTDNSSLIDFVPTSLTLADSYTMSSQQLDQNASQIYHRGINNISSSTIPAIEKILKTWVNANTTSTEDLILSPEDKKKINDNYSKLVRYIKMFLGTDLRRTPDGHPAIFGKRIGEAKLSHGQTILLQFCIALYAQENDLENLIILMDEPENHLHPEALIEVLEKITPHVRNGQLWISTHSIHVLAHFSHPAFGIWTMVNYPMREMFPKKLSKACLEKKMKLESFPNFCPCRLKWLVINLLMKVYFIRRPK